MFPRADIVGTRPVASVEATKPTAPAGDAHQELAQRLNRIALGTFLEGEVLTRLNDGTFAVKVADTAVRMNLPTGTQVGETLDLTLIATEPRPSFVLTTPTRDNSASLSSAGRLVDWIIHTAKAEGAPTALLGKTPLAPSADTNPVQLAASMKDMLEFSGLFYESHVAQWVDGERPLPKLLQEPQAKNSNLPLVAAALKAAASAVREGDGGMKPASTPHLDTAHLARLFENLGGQHDVVRALMTVLQAARPSTPNLPASAADVAEQSASSPPTTQISATPEAAPPEHTAHELTATEPHAPELGPSTLPADTSPATVSGADEPSPATMPTAPNGQPLADADVAVHPKAMNSESVNMVSLQLNTLEQQRITWQGELWPGQQIEWEIGEDTPQGTQIDAQERTWQSVVRLDMPVLGKLSATVRLAGERLQIQVSATDEDTASLLRAHGGALSSALAAAGSPLDLLTVKRDGNT